MASGSAPFPEYSRARDRPTESPATALDWVIIFQEDWGGYNLVAWKPSSGCQQALAGDRGFMRFICPVVAFTVFALSVHFLLTYLATGMMAGDVYRENSVRVYGLPTNRPVTHLGG